MMVEDVIPSLKAILEAQDDLSEIELFFQENRVSPLFVIHSMSQKLYYWLNS